ncbi:mannose-1-phosphate guanylyltransferase/mannose-6-phosphate isomerase [Actibacterium lipolyticum]|uniref:mannose-1-phosphate guanylyltransferase n=1 Tax=Actibacterium lipolyticum TaxID=1524263 RepID=A0A238JKA7_9RHOB|nr:mannose-1-phosphate guanylyltransferase/mannose-6-phosphate isomerase [Actibacterium lipolyticum]SMX31098.1 Alginate biosynthesis protein AlgA [Actibacterium lipolyticum]
MKQQYIRPVILCGGNGKRLWPISRRSMPKQFARLSGDKTMLQDTIGRLEDAGCNEPIFVTGEDYRFIVAGQAEEIGVTGHKIILEPEGRNTAAAICAAAEVLHQDDPNALMLVAPSDHCLEDTLEFAQAVAQAAIAARNGKIVTFGVRPDRPETGYGYIELAAESAALDTAQPFVKFVEKPDLDKATQMVEDGRFLWNSGMFLMSVATAREAFGQHVPDLQTTVSRSVQDAEIDLGFVRLSAAFSDAPEIAFDYAVMENTAGWVVPLASDWSDLGSWRSVWSETARDADGVATRGAAHATNCKDVLLFSDDENVEVVGVGLRNIAAIATRDAVLITDLDDSQAVSDVVVKLKADKVRQAEEFLRHARPWGHYETLALGPRFQVKSIVVKPGGQLSLQSHVHRAEHWVVVEGTATVTIGKEEKLVSENQSVYIPLGEVHRLANDGKVPLQLIEVQTGAYLGEDDIVRYEDIYART